MMKQFASIEEYGYMNGYFLTVHARNMPAGHLTACMFVTSKALHSFVKVNDWDPHKNEIGEKIFTFVTRCE